MDHPPGRRFSQHGSDAGDDQHCFARSGGAHDNAPDKVPAKRLRTIEEAGKQSVPFTTGLLIGIGETPEDRVDTLLAIRELHRRYGHIQEVIVQNFRVQARDIPMRDWPEPTRGEMLRTVAVARLLMPEVNMQAPPNLSAPYYERTTGRGNQRLGRRFAADAGLHQSGKALAAPGTTAVTHRGQEDTFCASAFRFIRNS